MNVIKKLLIATGVVFIALLIVGGVFIGFTAYRGFGLDKSSRAYVDENVPPIVSRWSKDELLRRASPQLLTALQAKPEEIEQVFTWLSSLGPLKHYNGSKGEAKMLYDSKQGSVTTADYLAAATFEQGDASISVRLIQAPSGQWQFLSFHVNSPALLKPMTPAKGSPTQSL